MPPEDDAVDRGDVVPAAEVEVPEVEEPVAQAEPEVEAAADEKPADDAQHGNMIPQTRFNQAVGKERTRAETAEAELQKYYQREQQQVLAQDFEASRVKQAELLKQHSSLLADGDLDKASEVMGDVLQLRDDMQNARMDRQADNARNSAKVEVQYDSTVGHLETEYPEINPDSEEFDQVAVRRVQLMVTGIMQSEGKNPAEALIEATNILLKPQKDAKGLRDKPSEEAIESGLRRTQQQIDKNIKTAAAQPPTTAEIGADHDKTGGALDADTVSKLSWEEFVKVPDDELAKMRGDFIQ